MNNQEFDFIAFQRHFLTTSWTLFFFRVQPSITCHSRAPSDLETIVAPEHVVATGASVHGVLGRVDTEGDKTASETAAEIRKVMRM